MLNLIVQTQKLDDCKFQKHSNTLYCEVKKGEKNTV